MDSTHVAEYVLEAQKAWARETLNIALDFVSTAARRQRTDVVLSYLHEINLVAEAFNCMLGSGLEAIFAAALVDAVEEMLRP